MAVSYETDWSTVYDAEQARSYFNEGFADESIPLLDLVFSRPTSTGKETMTGLSGTTLFSERAAGSTDDFEELPFKEGYSKSAVIVDYLAGFTFSSGDWADLPEYLKAHAVKQLGAAGPKTINLAIANWIAGMGTTSTGADTKAIGANDHPVKHAGGTQDNLTTSAYSDSVYNTIRIAMQGMVDDHGNLDPQDIYAIVFSPTLAKTMYEVHASEKYGNTNTLNFAHQGAMLRENPWMTDSNDYRILPKPSPNGPAVLLMRKSPDFVADYDKKSRAAFMNSEMRLVVTGARYLGAYVGEVP